jgi:uncharacterized protein (TIGR03435 family)
MVKRGLVALLCLAPFAIPTPRAQDADVPAFEAASIKETDHVTPVRAGADRFVRSHITLVQLLIHAHEISDFQIEGGPDWVRTRRYDVEAKADRSRPASEMRLMVRRLMAERFNLKAHIETRERPRYALVTTRSDKRLGPKLKPAAFDCPAIVAARGPDFKPPSGPPQPGEPPRCGVVARLGGGSRTLMAEGQPMSAIARMFQSLAGRVIVDKTGLSGTFDLEVETEIVELGDLPPNTFGEPKEGLSLSTALREQLGLRLESERGPVEVLVIDSVDLPTPN